MIGKVLRFTKALKDKILENHTNKQLEVTATSLTLTDSHYRTTFFINAASLVTVTVPSTGLRDNFICFFVIEGVGNLRLNSDGLGAVLNAPSGTLLAQNKRGMLERKLTSNTYFVSGEWE